MYSILDKVSSKDAIHIIHYVVKILNKRKNGPVVIVDIDKIETDLNDEQEVIADKLLEEIGFENLRDESIIDKRIVELYEILKSKANDERQIDVNRGKELLKKMKEIRD